MPRLIIDIPPGSFSPVLARLKEQLELGTLDGVVGIHVESSRERECEQRAAKKAFRRLAATLDPTKYDRAQLAARRVANGAAMRTRRCPV